MLKVIPFDLMKQDLISNYHIFRHLGFDIVIFLDIKGKFKVEFLELKLYKGQRVRDVGFSNQRDEGPQVEVLMNDKEMLKFSNKFLK